MSKEKKGRASNHMGTMVKRKGRYYVVVKFQGKAFWKSCGTGDAKEAEKFRKEYTATFQTHSEIDAANRIQGKILGLKQLDDAAVEKNALRLPQAWDAFVASPFRRPSLPVSLVAYQRFFEAFRVWYKRDCPVRDVSADDAQRFQRHFLAEHSQACTNQCMAGLYYIWKVLTKAAKLTANPWAVENVPRPAVTKSTRRELTVDELKRVIETADPVLRLLFLVGVYTGLRIGDASTLKWDEVDLARGVISLIPAKTRRLGERARVIIPIHPSLGTVLGAVPPEARTGYVNPQAAETYLRDNAGMSALVEKHFQSCGIETQGTYEDGRERASSRVSFHSLRHTFVSLCAASNVPYAVVQHLVGHSSSAMTEHYTHMQLGPAKMAIAALPSVTGGGEAPRASRLADVLALLPQLTAEERAQVKAACG